MPWSSLQIFLRRISTPLRHLISCYALLVALFTLLRLLRVNGAPAIDLANTFAPYWFMPLVVTFPLSIIVTRGGALPAEYARKRLSRLSKTVDGQNALSNPPRWSVLLQICLIAIGLYWFAAPGMYRPVEPPKGETFTVVTFNVQGSNPELKQATDWLLGTAPDLIVLQETAPGYDQRLAPLYDVYAHEDHIEGSARVFSRYAILERDILRIEDEPGLEALRLLLNLGGRELAVYAAHFTLPLKPRAQFDPHADIGPEALLRYDERRRNAQIRRFLAVARVESKPYVVAGDFNMSDASLIYDEVAAQMQDAWRGAGVGAGRTWPVAEAIGLPRVIQPLLRIDYIWHSADLRPTAATVGEAIGSDHLPVTVVFEWRADTT
ncbi:MAG: endonuclease/exonuclease/phosphatase family protein [Chloroflexi bacterium]|nr:endonuclease/exonuclease/phosphatase family protein [Chloroflexota bacterium]